MTFVRTVLGDRDPATLGVTNYHEHLFQVSPLLVGDELDDEELSTREAASLFGAGTRTMVEATPIGVGRNVAATSRISEMLGLNIIHVTGAHHSGHYAEDHPLMTLDAVALAERFTREVEVGFGVGVAGQPIRAGVVKAGIRYWSIPPFERRVLEAAAATTLATGAPMMIHLDFGSAAHEVLDILEGEGVAAHSVALAHVDRNLDPSLHVSLAERGAYLGYDGAARHREAPDSAIVSCLAAVVGNEIAASRVLIGGDVARASRYRSYGGLPGIDYLAKRFLPRLLDSIGSAAVDLMTITNPARWLTFDRES